jgi:hypothetical protein
VQASESQASFLLVRDPYGTYPSFEGFLYMSLDYQLVILYILWFFYITTQTENDVLAIFIVYLIEKVLYFIRKTLGKRNLVKKAMSDEHLLM